MTSVLSRLRSETRDLHELVEENPLHRAIVEGTVTLESYLSLLKRMYRIHHCFEYWTGSRKEWPEFQFDFGEHRHLSQLDLDLAALGSAISRSCLSTAILPLQDAGFPFLLGYFYVLEGSSLGGQILSRLLAQHLGLTPEHGGAYFHSYGSLVGERWRSTQQLLSRVGTTVDAADATVAGARDAFTRIDAILRVTTLSAVSSHTPDLAESGAAALP